MADDTAQPGWMSDVQRALAIILVATFSVALLVMVVRVTFWGDIPTISDILKIMVPALINVVTFVLGYFYGSSKAKDTSDTSQQKIVDKLTSTPTPIAPAPAVAWWTKLSDSEKTAITTAQGLGSVSPDARVAAFVTASQVGAATPDDLNYLVSKGLLTAARANEIKG